MSAGCSAHEEFLELFLNNDASQSIQLNFDVARRRALRGCLRSSSIRSVCWRSFLRCVPRSDPTRWHEDVRTMREEYAALAEKHLPGVELTADEVAEDRWVGPFNDVEPEHKELRDRIVIDLKRYPVEDGPLADPLVKHMMLRVLFLFGVEQPDIGYHQGFPDILAPITTVVILEALHDEKRCMPANVPIVGDPCSSSSTECYLCALLDPRWVEADVYATFSAVAQAVGQWYPGVGRGDGPVEDIVELPALPADQEEAQTIVGSVFGFLGIGGGGGRATSAPPEAGKELEGSDMSPPSPRSAFSTPTATPAKAQAQSPAAAPKGAFSSIKAWMQSPSSEAESVEAERALAAMKTWLVTPPQGDEGLEEEPSDPPREEDAGGSPDGALSVASFVAALRFDGSHADGQAARPRSSKRSPAPNAGPTPGDACEDSARASSQPGGGPLGEGRDSGNKSEEASPDLDISVDALRLAMEEVAAVGVGAWAGGRDHASPAKTKPSPVTLDVADDLGQSRTVEAACAHILHVMLPSYDRELYDHLEKEEVPVHVIVLRWIRLLCAREFHLNDLMVIWDAIFADGASLSLIYHICVAVLLFLREPLLTQDGLGCHQRLSRLPPVEDPFIFAEQALMMKYQNTLLWSTNPRTLSHDEVPVPQPISEARQTQHLIALGEQSVQDLIDECTSLSHVSVMSEAAPEASVLSGWTYDSRAHGVHLFRKKMPNSPFLCFLGKGAVELEPASIAMHLKILDTRYHVDKLLKRVRLIANLDGGDTQIVHMEHEATNCVLTYARDFCLLVTMREVAVYYDDGPRTCYIVAARSVKHSGCPENPSMIRGCVLHSGWFVEPNMENEERGSIITYITQVDLGGPIPVTLLNHIAQRQPLCISYLRKYLLDQERALEVPDGHDKKAPIGSSWLSGFFGKDT